MGWRRKGSYLSSSHGSFPLSGAAALTSMFYDGIKPGHSSYPEWRVFSNFSMVFAVISEVLICLWIFLTWGLLLEEFNLRHLIPHEILDATAIVKHKILSMNDDLRLCQHVGPPNRCLPESLLKDTRVLLLTSYINSGLHIIIWELVGRHTVPSSSGILIIIWIYLILLSVCVPLDQY